MEKGLESSLEKVIYTLQEWNGTLEEYRLREE